MRSLKFSLVLILMIAISTDSDGKVADHFETSGKQETVQVVDPRLAQKVNYQAAGKNLQQVLHELSAITGVKLKAGYNDSDWQVRDRKMVIAVKDVSLADLMNSIARTMKFNWSRNSKVDPPSYRLYMDRSLLLEANQLMKEQLDVLRQEIDEKRVQELAKFLDLAEASPEQLAEVKNENPRMYLEAKSGAAKSFAALLNAAPDLYEALLSGQEIEVSASSLSPAGQQALLQMAEDLAKPDGPISLYPNLRRPLPPDFASRMEQIQIRINMGLSKSLSNSFNRGVELGHFAFRCGGLVEGIALLNPDSAHIVNEKMKLKMAEEEVPWSEAFHAYELEYQQARIEEKKSDPAGEALIEHPEDSDLEVKVKLEVEKHQLAAYQIALADKSGFGVVSDWYGGWGESIDLPKTDISIRSILDQIQDRYHYNWERHGRVLEFRDRLWYWKRSAQIPEAWLEDWRNTLKETGTLDIDKLVQVSMLTAEQYNFNIPGDEFFAGDIARIMGNCGEWGFGLIIQAYGKLDATERKMLFKDSAGFWVSDLSPQARELVEKYLASFNPQYLDDPRPNIRLTATRKKLGKQFEYVFMLTPDANIEPVEIKFTTPKYEPKAVEPANKDKAESSETTAR